MESLRNEPVYLGGQPSGVGGTPIVVNTPAGGGYGGYGDNGLLSTILIASMLGRGGFGGWGNGDVNNGGAGTAYAQRAADNSSQLLTSVTKAEGDIKEATAAAIARMQLENAMNFSSLKDRSCEVEKEAIKAGYEARLEALQTKSDLLANQNQNTISIKDDIKDLRFDMDSKFCHLNNSIDKQFCALGHQLEHGFNRIAERDLKEENDRLRDKLNTFRYNDERRDISEIKRDVDRIVCGLSKVPSTVVTPSILDGCGC